MKPSSKKILKALCNNEPFGMNPFPSVKSIHNMLDDIGIKHQFGNSEKIGEDYLHSIDYTRKHYKVKIKVSEDERKIIGGNYVIEFTTSDLLSFCYYNAFNYYFPKLIMIIKIRKKLKP